MSEFQFGGEFVWHPSAELIAQSNLQQFISKHRLGSYDDLMRRSTRNIAWFWDTVLRDLGIEFYKPYSQVVDLSDGKPWARWCVGGEMNIVHNLLDKYADTQIDKKLAIKSEIEDGTTRELTYKELRDQVDRMANSLSTLELGKGDAIGVFMPMVPEIVVAMLAIIKIGGIFLPLFSGFGTAAIVSRSNDANAKALFTAAGTYRRGKFCPMKPVADDAAAQIPTLRHLVVLNQAGEWLVEDLSPDAGPPTRLRGPFDDATTEHTSAEEPMMIIYTSGTTGKPKGAVHTHCGFPIKSAQDMWHGLDLHEDETLFWMTDMGWMMGPWEVFGTLLLGATMMLYDGAPDFPGPDRVWSLVDRHKVTALGVSPTLIRALRRHGYNIVHRHDLSSLRKFASTGEPWNPEPWMWLFQNVGHGKLPIINYSGGTEISGGILMGNVLTPIKPCAFSGPLPGMAADVVDEDGKSVRRQVGELVIREPWIGMTRGFWKDAQRYIETYWSRFPDVWVHGDWAAVDESRCNRRAGFNQRRSARLLLRIEEGRKRRRGSSSRIEKERRARSRQSARAARSHLCRRHTKNAERKSDAPRCARRVLGRKAWRHVSVGKPGVLGRNQAGGSKFEVNCGCFTRAANSARRMKQAANWLGLRELVVKRHSMLRRQRVDGELIALGQDQAGIRSRPAANTIRTENRL